MQKKSLNITLLGYGRMGHETEKIALKRGHKISLVIDHKTDWISGYDKLSQCDVAIDFSLPETAIDNIFNCFDAGIPVVMGTTGWYHLLPDVTIKCVEKEGTLFYAPNFSLGMNMVFKLNSILARMIKSTHYEASIREIHHVHKKDAPSGTAIKLANDIVMQSAKYKGWTNSKAAPGKLLIESVRKDEVPGTHEIFYRSPEDEILIRHTAVGREGFALGAVVAAEFIINKKGIYTMDDLIKNQSNDQT